MLPDPLVELAGLEGVPSALTAARDAVDLGLRRWRSAATAEGLAVLRRVGAQASAELTDDPERWRPGSWAVATELDSLSPLVKTAPLQAVARAHALAGAGQVPRDSLGRIRSSAAGVDRIQALAALLTRPTAAPALVVASIAHAEIASVAPFGAADDVVARAVERMVLMATGVDTAGVVPVEAGHLQLVSDYRRCLAGYATGGLVGVREWILHCTRAVQAAVQVQLTGQ